MFADGSPDPVFDSSPQSRSVDRSFQEHASAGGRGDVVVFDVCKELDIYLSGQR